MRISQAWDGLKGTKARWLGAVLLGICSVAGILLWPGAHRHASYQFLQSRGAVLINAFSQARPERKELLYIRPLLAVLIGTLLLVLQRLRSREGHANKAITARARFITNISHEIRNPMNGVIGMTDLLLESELTSQQREHAETVRGSARTILTMLDDLLDYSRMDEGSSKAENVDFDLHGVLEDVIDHYSSMAFKKGLEISCSIAPDVPQVVKGDAIRLRQVLAHLVNNAVRFTEIGDVQLIARVISMSPDGVVMQVNVTDTGVGMGRGGKDKLFSGGEPAAPHLGSGANLGLAICKQIVDRTGGFIDYETSPGKGSDFWVVLKFEAASFELPAREADAVLGNKHVLMVSPLAGNGRALVTNALFSGMHVSEASSAQGASRLMNSAGPFDLMIVDDRLNASSLEEISDWIDERPVNAMRTILLSGPELSKEAKVFLMRRSATLMAKPVRLARFVQASQAALKTPLPRGAFSGRPAMPTSVNETLTLLSAEVALAKRGTL